MESDYDTFPPNPSVPVAAEQPAEIQNPRPPATPLTSDAEVGERYAKSLRPATGEPVRGCTSC